MRFRSSLFRALPALLLFAGSAFSAPLTITFASSLLTASRGQTVTFTATLTNTTAAPLFLNGDAFNVAPPLLANDLKFLVNFPLSLIAGQVFTAPAFDITVPLTAPFGTYAGQFDVLGGANANASTTIGTATFAVANIPEPATFGSSLVALGCAVLFLRKTRRRSKSDPASS
jgi:hypothetical protein